MHNNSLNSNSTCINWKQISRKLIVGIITLISVNLYAQPTFIENYPDSLNKKRLVNVIGSELTTYAAGLSFLSFIWYKDHERVPFHFYNDNKGYLQMDKLGHAYGAYRESFAAYYALRWAGLDKRKAIIYGAPIGLIFQTPIEVFDGLYEGWGFSWGDMASNATGSILFAFQEIVFDEQVVLMKFSYSPSGYPKYHHILGETQLENFFLDYNGHTYWFSANLKRITNMNDLPNWLNIAFGYSGNGMIKEFENPTFYNGELFPYLPRYRQYIFSLDVDFAKIPVKKNWVKKIFRSVNLIKIPFPSIEINNQEGLKFRPVYF